MARLEFTKQLKDMEALVKRFGDKSAADVRAAGLAATGDKGAEQGILEGRKAAERLRDNIESNCLDMLLLQQPLIGDDLRFVSSSFRIVSDLAHIDGMTRDVAFIFSELSKKASDRMADKFVAMSGRAAEMVDGAVEAFLTKDADKAREVIASDDELDRMYSESVDLVIDLIKAGKPSAKSLPELLMVAKYFERIGDHAQRIADWAVFRATGERILTAGDHAPADEAEGA
ncbi:PhoU domain-containing protein [uncultured Parolsenella sp.]|uniref:phosphate signaling complex PhoU family protein n=1 Tax=uncultured Parolsenella sp. TaxID=2083008 RepID=UPI0027D99006|nr:PhoU domain-containing protein [uncultured Parolsenella sp.]